MHQHPLITHYQTTREQTTHKISDLLSTNQWQQTDLSNEFFRPIGHRHQMAFAFSITDSLVIGLAFNRSGKDFNERDRLVLDLLSPHLTQAFRNAEAFTRLHRQLAALQQLVDHQHQAALEVDQKGNMLWATPAAWRPLQRY